MYAMAVSGFFPQKAEWRRNMTTDEIANAAFHHIKPTNFHSYNPDWDAHFDEYADALKAQIVTGISAEVFPQYLTDAQIEEYFRTQVPVEQIADGELVQSTGLKRINGKLELVAAPDRYAYTGMGSTKETKHHKGVFTLYDMCGNTHIGIKPAADVPFVDGETGIPKPKVAMDTTITSGSTKIDLHIDLSNFGNATATATAPAATAPAVTPTPTPSVVPYTPYVPQYTTGVDPYLRNMRAQTAAAFIMPVVNGLLSGGCGTCGYSQGYSTYQPITYQPTTYQPTYHPTYTPTPAPYTPVTPGGPQMYTPLPATNTNGTTLPTGNGPWMGQTLPFSGTSNGNGVGITMNNGNPYAGNIYSGGSSAYGMTNGNIFNSGYNGTPIINQSGNHFPQNNFTASGPNMFHR